MNIIKYIQEEWDVLKKAPLSFVILLFIGLSSGFAFGLFWRGQEVSNYESALKMKDSQIDEYKKSINDRLEKVEKTLTANQLSSLELSLKAAPSKVIISADSVSSKGYAKQIKDVFTKSGWEVDTKSAPVSLDTFMLETKGSVNASAVSRALSTADVPFKSKMNEAKGTIEFQLDK